MVWERALGAGIRNAEGVVGESSVPGLGAGKGRPSLGSAHSRTQKCVRVGVWGVPREAVPGALPFAKPGLRVPPGPLRNAPSP